MEGDSKQSGGPHSAHPEQKRQEAASGGAGPVASPRRAAPFGSVGRPGQSTILLGVTILAILGFIALPVLKSRRQDGSAAEDARATYLSLMAQMESDGSRSGVTIPDGRESSGRQPTAIAGDPGAEGTGAATSGAMQRPRLERDLFAPASRVKPAKDPEVIRAAKRQPPKLTGIFIDGTQAKAVVGGEVVSEGDWVKGFQVAEINPSWVLLRRGTQFERLNLGGRR